MLKLAASINVCSINSAVELIDVLGRLDKLLQLQSANLS